MYILYSVSISYTLYIPYILYIQYIQYIPDILYIYIYIYIYIYSIYIYIYIYIYTSPFLKGPACVLSFYSLPYGGHRRPIDLGRCGPAIQHSNFCNTSSSMVCVCRFRLFCLFVVLVFYVFFVSVRSLFAEKCERRGGGAGGSDTPPLEKVMRDAPSSKQTQR